MKAIPLLHGMIVYKKIHHGKHNYNLKSFVGIIRSCNNGDSINVKVHQNKDKHFVFATAYLDNTFVCGHCLRHTLAWNATMVMN